MFQQIASRLTYARVTATLALFLAVGGGWALATVGGEGTVKFGAEKGLIVGTWENVLVLPDVGKLQARCSKGTAVRFRNTSGQTLQATVEKPSSDDFDSASLSDGQSLESFTGLFDPETLRFQVFRASAAGVPAADITVGSLYREGDCDDRVITAQAVAHG